MPAAIVVLGPPDILAPEPCHIGPGLSRLLGLLVSASGDPIRTGSLVERLWPDEAPRTGAAALRVQVTRLRRCIGSQASIVSSPGRGYRLVTDAPGDLTVDSITFRQQIVEADSAAREHVHDAAVALYRLALGKWRGVAFDGCDDDPDVRVVQAGLDALRDRARRSLVTSLFHLGEVVGQGADLTEAHEVVAERPGDEELAAIFMEGLERLGQTSEALRVFRRTESHLRDELGVGPSPRLQAAVDRLAVGLASSPGG